MLGLLLLVVGPAAAQTVTDFRVAQSILLQFDYDGAAAHITCCSR